MSKLMLLAIDLIRSTKKKRRGVCSHRVDELCFAIESGEDIHPIRVNLMEDGTFAVKDGRHRLAAHKAIGMTQIWAIVENIMRTLLRKWGQFVRNLLQTPQGVFLFVDHAGLEPATSSMPWMRSTR